MLTLDDLFNYRERKSKKAEDSELRKLPYKHAFIYGRVSTQVQVRDSHESIREIARLVDLAEKDGYMSNLCYKDIEAKLASFDKKSRKDNVWSDGEITVDVQDLGISGQCSFDVRRGLSELEFGVTKGIIGCVYLTEGVSRLSRDRDRIIPYYLLKILKEQQCRVRTPEGVWNPAIDYDWNYLTDEFEDAISELKFMTRRLYRRKIQKASRGEYVGESIPIGYILPIIGQKPSGKYEFGKIKPYPNHVEIINLILEEFIRQNGSFSRTSRALKNFTIPFFDQEFQYMERLTSLRSCPRTHTGYKITPLLVRGLATNLKLIGVWCYGDVKPIINNHEAIVSRELFFQAFELAINRKHIQTGLYEQNEWTGLIYCVNHPIPIRMHSDNRNRYYKCEKEYKQDINRACLIVPSQYLDQPLTSAITSYLSLAPLAGDILRRFKLKTENKRIRETLLKKQVTRLKASIAKLQVLFTHCVDASGEINRDKEELYWSQIQEAKQRLSEIKTSISPEGDDLNNLDVDCNCIQEFLNDLTSNWYTYPLSWRNQLLRLVIDKTEIQASNDVVDAVIYWKSGFKQKVIIYKPRIIGARRRWTNHEDNLLKSLYSSASADELIMALPNRSWAGITRRGVYLNINRTRKPPSIWRAWKPEEDELLKLRYKEGIPNKEIACEVGRTTVAVIKRIDDHHLSRFTPLGGRKQMRWKIIDLGYPISPSLTCPCSFAVIDFLTEIFTYSLKT